MPNSGIIIIIRISVNITSEFFAIEYPAKLFEPDHIVYSSIKTMYLASKQHTFIHRISVGNQLIICNDNHYAFTACQELQNVPVLNDPLQN